LAERAGSLPVVSLIGLLSAVLGVGPAVSFAATFAAIRSPLLAGLRSE
jgi:hypothetical protein